MPTRETPTHIELMQLICDATDVLDVPNGVKIFRQPVTFVRHSEQNHFVRVSFSLVRRQL